MTADLDSSPRRFSSDHSHQHGNIAKSKKKQETFLSKNCNQQPTNVKLCVQIGNSWKNSQNSFSTGNPGLRPADTNCLWHSSSKALKYEYDDSQHASPLNLSRCTQPWQHSLRALITVTAGTNSCHLLNQDRHCPPKEDLGMEMGTAEREIESLTLIVSSARSRTAHCFGVRLLVSSLTIWSCKQPLYLTWVCCQRLKGKESPVSPVSPDSCCICVATALIQLFKECLMESQSHLLQLNLEIN